MDTSVLFGEHKGKSKRGGVDLIENGDLGSYALVVAIVAAAE